MGFILVLPIGGNVPIIVSYGDNGWDHPPWIFICLMVRIDGVDFGLEIGGRRSE